MSQRDIFDEKESVFSEVPYLRIERRLWASGFSLIAGVDEAGRGPIAGPVVAAACILPKDFHIPTIQDSKVLPEAVRDELHALLTNDPQIVWSISIIDHETIDQINILRATLLAMRQAVEKLRIQPDFVLIDGRDAPPLTMAHQAIIKGDSSSQSIAAASIIAKVERDKIMKEAHVLYPEFGFNEHKGYGTAKHLKAIREHGITPIHRKSFAPIARNEKAPELTLF